MRLLMIHPAFTTPQGVANTRSYEMAQRLLAAGHEVVVLCARVQGSFSGLEGPFVRGIRRGTLAGLATIEVDAQFTHSMPLVERILANLRFCWYGARVALCEPHDRVVAVVAPLVAVVPALVSRWLRRRDCILELRDRVPPRAFLNPLMRWPMHWIERLYARTFTRAIALTPYHQQVLKRLGIAEQNIVLIPYANTLAPASPSKMTPPEGQIIAAYVGALDAAHDLDIVLDAAAILKQRGREHIQIMLIGDGHRKADLLDRVRYEGLTRVHIHTPKKRLSYSELLRTAQIGLEIMADIPALYQGASNPGFGNYMAAGLPVIVNYPAWASELVHTHDCGITVMAQHAPALADALESLAADPALRQKQGTHAEALARTLFEPAMLADHYVEWVSRPTGDTR